MGLKEWVMRMNCGVARWIRSAQRWYGHTYVCLSIYLFLCLDACALEPPQGDGNSRRISTCSYPQTSPLHTPLLSFFQHPPLKFSNIFVPYYMSHPLLLQYLPYSCISSSSSHSHPFSPGDQNILWYCFITPTSPFIISYWTYKTFCIYFIIPHFVHTTVTFQITNF